MDNIFRDIQDECNAQYDKWDTLTHTFPEWMSILGEEVGEVCEATNAVTWGGWGDQAPPLLNLRKELIQVAAVCVAITAQIDKMEDRKAQELSDE